MSVLVKDTLTAANGIALIGRTTEIGGKTWARYGTTHNWTIQNNQAKPTTLDYDVPLYVDAGIADQIAYSIKLSTYHSTTQIFWRISNQTNYFCFEGNKVYFVSNNGGSWTVVGTLSQTPVSGDIFKVELKGNQHSIFLNGTSVLTPFNHTSYVTATGYGISGNSTTMQFDDFTIEDFNTGTPTGTDGSTTFDLKQLLYRDASTLMDSKLSMYVDSSFSADTKQSIYQDSSLFADSIQKLYSDSTTPYDSKQILFNDSFMVFDTLQEFFSDGIDGSTPFDMRFIFYSDNLISFDSKQAFYEENSFINDLRQQIYREYQNIHDTQLTLFRDNLFNVDLKQQIYSDSGVLFDTKFSLFNDFNINFDVENKLYQQSSIQSDVRLSIYQDNMINIPLLIQLYDSGNIEFDTLQMILDGFSEYQQVLKYVLKIVQKQNSNLNINDLLMHYQLGIVQKLYSDIELSGSKKSFDLKI